MTKFDPIALVKDPSNGNGSCRLALVIVFVAAVIGITVLGALRDINSQAIVILFSAIIAGTVGHANGYRLGRLTADKERLEKDAQQ